MKTTFNPNFAVPKGHVACDAASFAKDAVELALFLLDKFLLCPQSGVGYVRIIETEAYPVDDGVYSAIFGNEETQRAIPDRAGVLFRMSSRLHLQPNVSLGGGFSDYLYVTAKGSGEAGALRPVVLIRSCVPYCCDFVQDSLIGRNPAARLYLENLGYDYKIMPNNALKYLLINPHMVADVLEPDFKSSPPSDPVLYAGTGCRLYICTDIPQDPIFGPVLELCGIRVPPEQPELLALPGLASKFRFLLATDIPYELFKGDVFLMTVYSEAPPQAFAGPSQVVMDPQQMVVVEPQWVPLDPPLVPMYPHQQFVPMGQPQAPVNPPQAPIIPPAPEFSHFEYPHYGPS